ncbi:MAG: hypothetical protein E7575_05695 [Ruminococcaceae bacterium]|nr:hypothetical protein [Oscillospiraceae bacterium]
MIKIRILDPESEKEKVIPIPYFAMKKVLGVVIQTEKGKGCLDKIVSDLKKFSKKNPGFIFVDIKDSDGTEVTITL